MKNGYINQRGMIVIKKYSLYLTLIFSLIYSFSAQPLEDISFHSPRHTISHSSVLSTDLLAPRALSKQPELIFSLLTKAASGIGKYKKIKEKFSSTHVRQSTHPAQFEIKKNFFIESSNFSFLNAACFIHGPPLPIL